MDLSYVQGRKRPSGINGLSGIKDSVFLLCISKAVFEAYPRFIQHIMIKGSDENANWYVFIITGAFKY